jgi:hypothetical protein
MTSRSEDADDLLPTLTRSLNFFEARLNALQSAIEAVVFSEGSPKESILEFAERLHGICLGDTSDD